MTNHNYIDINDGLSRVRGNKTLFKRMLTLFLASPEFAEFDVALAENRIEDAANAAHAIKGMTGNLGLMQLYEISAELMNQLRGGDYQEETMRKYREIYSGTRADAERMLAEE